MARHEDARPLQVLDDDVVVILSAGENQAVETGGGRASPTSQSSGTKSLVDHAWRPPSVLGQAWNHRRLRRGAGLEAVAVQADWEKRVL